MMLSTRGVALLVAIAAPSLSMAGTPAPAAFRVDDPRHAALRALETQASTLFDSDDYALSMSQKTRDAWAALRNAAMKVKVAGDPHPLAGVAIVNLASMDQIDGRNPDALAHADQGLALLAPFRDAYPISWMQGLSIRGYIQAALGDSAAGADTLAQASAYIDGYFARTPPAAIDESAQMLRSNIAFAHGQALSRLGRNAEAVEAQHQSMAARIAAVGPNSPDSVGSYYTYAQMLSRADRNAEAEIFARRAVDTATDHVDRNHPSYARALEALGLLLSRTGRRAESLAYLERAIAIKRETVGTKSLYFHFGLQNLGSILLPLERYGEAEPLFLEAERGFRAIEGEHSPQSARALAFAGIVSRAEGRTDQAIDRLQTVLGRVTAGTAEDREMGRRVYPFLIPALLEAGRAAPARAAAADFTAAVAQLDNAPGFAITDAAMLSAWAARDMPAASAAASRMAALLRENQTLADDGELTEDQRAALDAILAIAADTQNPALALDAMAILAGSRIAQANRLVTARLVADPALAARVRTLQDKVKALQSADSAMLKALANDMGVEPARAAYAAMAAGVAAERAAIARDYPRWVESRGGARPDIVALRSGLERDAGLLAVMPAFDGVYLLAIGRDGARVERAGMSRAAMVALIDRLRASLTPTGVDTNAAHILHTTIFTPGIRATLAHARSLHIVPTGAFAALPFAMLPERRIVAIGRDTPWLIHRYALTVQPDFDLRDGAVRPARLASRSGIPQFLGIGAPTPFPAPPGKAASPAVLAAYGDYRGGADGDALSRLPPLPRSAPELRAVARRFGLAHATLLLGDQASEAALLAQDLSTYSVILFATHGLVSGQMDGVNEPALVLSPPAPGAKGDGLLTASDVAAMRIDADWVILSACNTAAGNTMGGATYSGLAQAFRYAGAGSLLLSHWPVRDDASAFITLETVKGADNGLPRAVALQRAMHKLLRSNRPDAVQPYIWAPFILVGR